MNILFTICGRAGSKGFKNKNLKKMRDVPLVYYTLAVVYEYKERHKEHSVLTAVNTDSESLKDLVLSQNAIEAVYVPRERELAGDTVPKVAVIQDTYKQLCSFSPDIVVDLDITSPCRTASDIENIIDEYCRCKYDVVFSVVNARRSPYFNMVEKKENGYYQKICSSSYTARQQAPQSYELNASIYAYNPLFLNGPIEKTLLEYRCGITVMRDYLVLDIDSEEDFIMMQLLHSYYCEVDLEFKRIYERARDMCGE